MEPSKVSAQVNNFEVTISVQNDALLIEARNAATAVLYKASVPGKDLPNYTSSGAAIIDPTLYLESFRQYAQERGRNPDDATFEMNDTAVLTFNTYVSVGKLQRPLQVSIPLTEARELKREGNIEQLLQRYESRISDLERQLDEVKLSKSSLSSASSRSSSRKSAKSQQFSQQSSHRSQLAHNSNNHENSGGGVYLRVSRRGSSYRVHIKPPPGAARGKHDIVCVLDTSGSMQVDAQVKNPQTGIKEGQDISMLELMKHAVRTIVNTLDDKDRFALVTFNNNSRIEYTLQHMTAAAKQQVNSNILTPLQPSGQTNLWAGINSALDLLRNAFHSRDRHASVILLTDGEPNIFPPAGILQALQNYKRAHPDFLFSLHTSAIGKNTDSVLLSQLAAAGHGQYSFIPCPGFIGTVLVSNLANILSTFAANAHLAIESLSGASLVVRGQPTQHHDFPVLDLKYDQKRDFVFGVLPPYVAPASSASSSSAAVAVAVAAQNNTANLPLFRATLTYFDYASQKMQRLSVNGYEAHNNGDGDDDAMVEFHVCRFEFLEKVMEAWQQMKNGAQSAAVRIIEELAQKFNNVLTQLSSSSKQQSQHMKEAQEALRALIIDVEGEVKMAVTRQESFTQWGQHYLPSLVNAHTLQISNNFKDPGIQKYNGAFFTKIRDAGEANFKEYKPQEFNNRNDVDVQVYYNAGGGCLHGSGKVLLADGSAKLVKNVARGDRLMGSGKVLAVVKIKCTEEVTQFVELQGGLLITPSHPIWLEQEQRWAKPKTLRAPHFRRCAAVYNFVLDSGHTAIVNGVRCVTLGHGIQGADVGHPYFGTDRVVRELSQCRGWDKGAVEVQMNQFYRDEAMGQVAGLRMAQ